MTRFLPSWQPDQFHPARRVARPLFGRVLQSNLADPDRQPLKTKRFYDFASGGCSANSFKLTELTHCVKGQVLPFPFSSTPCRRLGDSRKGYQPSHCPSTPCREDARRRRRSTVLPLIEQRPPRSWWIEAGVAEEEAGGAVLSHRVAPAVPSAQRVFTSEFGMGSGGSPAP